MKTTLFSMLTLLFVTFMFLATPLLNGTPSHNYLKGSKPISKVVPA